MVNSWLVWDMKECWHTTWMLTCHEFINRTLIQEHIIILSYWANWKEPCWLLTTMFNHLKVQCYRHLHCSTGKYLSKQEFILCTGNAIKISLIRCNPFYHFQCPANRTCFYTNPKSWRESSYDSKWSHNLYGALQQECIINAISKINWKFVLVRTIWGLMALNNLNMYKIVVFFF